MLSNLCLLTPYVLALPTVEIENGAGVMLTFCVSFCASVVSPRYCLVIASLLLRYCLVICSLLLRYCLALASLLPRYLSLIHI